ncbi:MAG: hypothetical protein LQ346_004664 [Caloplaca aetnensis]|nr:MAG: hypothetical protein LQ346_004664 [Caloplaca aetnensis]
MTGTTSNKLEDQAATAALYVTRNDRAYKSKSNYPLDADNKLSSASAATSLKYANPRDLPSFPTTGLEHGEAGAGAAASLANANHKEFKLWKPGSSAPASKAAMLAKDYKPAPLWHPEDSAAGSKAALLAAREGGHVNIWQPESTSAGNSAAGQAMKAKGLSPQVFGGATADDNKKALMAATGAMSSNRRRAGSTPASPPPAYPDAANSAANALKAATSVSRSAGRGPQSKSPPPNPSPIDAARIHNAAVTNLSREMYTANPPVAPEVEESKRQQGLRAAAISMARQMYDVQQKAIEEAANHRKGDSHYAATSAQNRPPSSVISDDEPSAPRYVNLQEAAQKLAAERLAKLHDEHAAYRNYYGATVPVQKRLSIRGRPRRRASSDGNIPKGDDEQSKIIRNQMSIFKDELAQVDAKKRQRDRDALMAAAQRNVKASMTDIDEQVFNQTGKASPAKMEEWETKAKARAKAESDERMVNHGRVNIGGGKFLDQSEVDAIAAGRVQPTLDEITAKAEKQRARDEELRRQQEERERIAAEKVADQKERDLKTKEEWKRYRDEEKAETRAKKEEERMKKVEEKRLKEEEKRKSKMPKGSGLKDEERPMTASEAPVLDPIPSVEPMDSEDELKRPQLRTTLTEEIMLQAEEEKRASILADGRQKSSNLAQEPEALPSFGYPEDEIPGAINPDSPDAAQVAKRVFSAPVMDPSEDIAVPMPKHDESKPEVAEPTAVFPPLAPGSTATVPKPAEPIHQLISLPAATTETTVSGPTPAQRLPKGEGKVSSWLKSKLRRSSKPGKPANSKSAPIEDTSNEKAFVGGASLTAATSTSKSSTDPGSVREVAMVGKPSPTVPNATSATTSASAEVAPAVVPTKVDDDLNAASAQDKGKQQRRSRSSSPVSSLSSDEAEHPRGRSQLRREVTDSDENGGEQEFEEARDHFETEVLAPPAPLKDTVGRASDSPVRDSIFKEDL